jgi:N-(2-amino-2-carboxyethyl)-L-glutamate synthase
MDINEMANLSPFEMRRLAQTTGNTPLEPLSLIVNGVPRMIHLKLEGANPTGSTKDRTAKGLMHALQEQSLLRCNTTLVESTSGNLGVALSFLCKARGYSFIAVVDPKTTWENTEKMRLLGAQIELVKDPDESGGYLLSRLKRVQALCNSSPGYIWTNQYESSANPNIHFTDTGPEIYRQMHGKVDALFIAVSTGGTLAGVSRYFRMVSPTTRIIAVDVHGSVIFGTPAGTRLLTGIGSSRRSSFLTNESYDQYMQAHDQEAFVFCRALTQTTAFYLGGSSGAVLAMCCRYLQTHPEAEHVVCLCADHGTNYTSSIYNDTWMTEHGCTLNTTLPASIEIGERMHVPIR